MKQQGGNVIVEKSLLAKVFSQSDLSKTDHRVLLYLLTQLDTENLTHITYSKICEVLSLGRPAVMESFTNLINLKILSKVQINDTDIGYRFRI
jgi:predicted transcriptional regulator